MPSTGDRNQRCGLERCIGSPWSGCWRGRKLSLTRRWTSSIRQNSRLVSPLPSTAVNPSGRRRCCQKAIPTRRSATSNCWTSSAETAQPYWQANRWSRCAKRPSACRKPPLSRNSRDCSCRANKLPSSWVVHRSRSCGSMRRHHGKGNDRDERCCSSADGLQDQVKRLMLLEQEKRSRTGARLAAGPFIFDSRPGDGPPCSGS